MNLQKHTINEKPPADKVLLMVIDIDAVNNHYLWAVGVWFDDGWHCKYDDIGYTVIEWYELPDKYKINKEDFSYHQMRMEDFWGSV